MAQWMDYDPHRGVRETNVYDPDTDQLIVHKEQDLQGLLDRNQELANSGATNVGIKKGMWCYASIPLVIQYELLKKGLIVGRKSDTARILEEINQNYPKLKTTHKTHSLTRSRSPTKSVTPKPGPLLIVR